MRRTRTMVTIAAVMTASALVLAACSSARPRLRRRAARPRARPCPPGARPSRAGRRPTPSCLRTRPTSSSPSTRPGSSASRTSPSSSTSCTGRCTGSAQGTTPNLNLSLSVGKNPVYSNGSKTITIDLNNYKWSNGEAMSAQDVVFWMNMMHAEKNNYGAYVPGINAIPDDVTNVVATTPTEVTFTFSGAVNTNWYTYNNLSQITPAAEGVGHHRQGRRPRFGRMLQRRLRHQGHRHGLYQGVRLPGHLGRIQPVEPEGRQQLVLDLRHQPHLAGRGRSVAPDLVRRHRERHHGAERHLHRPGEGQAGQVRRGALHRRAHRVQRAAGRQDQRRLPAPGQCDQGHVQPAGGRGPGPASVRLLPERVLRLGVRLLPRQPELVGE